MTTPIVPSLNTQNSPDESIVANPMVAPVPLPPKKILGLTVMMLVLLVVVGIAGFYVGRASVVTETLTEPPINNEDEDRGVACTMEAKICPDGSAVGRSGPKCEFAACPTVQATDSSKIMVEMTNGLKGWVERQNPMDEKLLMQLDSTDQCASIFVRDLGPLTKSVEHFAAEYYQIPTVPVNPEALYKTQYRLGNYQSITIGPMGMGEVSNTIVGVEGRVIGVSSTLNIPDGIVTPLSSCTFPEAEAKKVIEGLRFSTGV